MVVTCLLGMRIPAVPVSEHNPVLSTNRQRYLIFKNLSMVNPSIISSSTIPLSANTFLAARLNKETE
jgi:hypothetical protein